MFRHVTRTARSVVAAWDRALKPAGLTGLQFNLLATLAGAGDLNVKGVARKVGMDPTTVPRAIAPLVRRRLIAVRVGEDGRERIVALTTLGRDKLARAESRWTAIQHSVVEGLGPDGWTATVTQLKHIRERLRAVDPRAAR